MKDNTNTEVQTWLNFANKDLLASKELAKSNVTDLNESISFHCQQAIEKSLKAYYIFKFQKAAPRIHDLQELVAMCALSIELEEYKDVIIDLTDRYFFARYPDSVIEEQQIEENVSEIVTVTETIVRVISNLTKSQSPAGE